MKITRRENHLNAGKDISKDEFIACVSDDPEFKYPSEIGESYVEWSSPATDYESWLCWDNGCIHTKNPMPEFVDKMIVVAEKLGAHVQGDDLEIYESSTRAIQPANFNNPVKNISAPSYTLIKSRLHIDGNRLTRKNKDGTVVISFRLADIEKAGIKKGIEITMVGLSVFAVILAWSCFYFIQHSLWQWTGIIFALLAALLLLSMQKVTLFIKTKHGNAGFPLYDQPEDNHAFAIMINMMIAEENSSAK